MKNSIVKCFFSSVFVMMFFISPDSVYSYYFNEIIAFGDSLTDVGNVAAYEKKGVSPVIHGYYRESRYSDSKVWVEYLAEYFQLPPRIPGRGNSVPLPALPSGNTWAWGGAEAANGHVQPSTLDEPVPNLLTQVDEYLAVNTSDPNTLYVIWAGADNLLVGDKFGPLAAEKSVKAVVRAMKKLAHAGARHILIFNLPKLSDAPCVRALGDVIAECADIYNYFYNKDLKNKIKQLKKNPKFLANIYFADIYSELNLAVKTVKKNGKYTPNFFVPGPAVVLMNIKDEGLLHFQKHDSFPEHFLFWDEVHPTTQGHQIIAGVALEVLNK